MIASIRTVASLTAEENEVSRYSNHLDGAEIAGIKAGECRTEYHASTFIHTLSFLLSRGTSTRLGLRPMLGIARMEAMSFGAGASSKRWGAGLQGFFAVGAEKVWPRRGDS